MSEPSRSRGKKVIAPRGRGRRSQAEREQISQAERERTSAREADNAREQARVVAETRRKENEKLRAQRRGRGGYMGRPVAAAGPFSAGPLSAGPFSAGPLSAGPFSAGPLSAGPLSAGPSSAGPSSAGPFSAGSVFPAGAKVGRAFPRPWAPSKRSSTSQAKRAEDGGPESSKADHGFSQTTEDGVHIKHEDGGSISSEEDEHPRPRENIDFITGISDEQSDADGDSLMPVRIRRIEHKDRAPPMIAEASSVVTHAKQLDSERDERHRRWRGVYDDEDDKLADKDVSDKDVSDDQPSMSSPQQPRSPETVNRGKKRQREDSPVFQTEEELQEHERQQKQTNVLKAELCGARLESHEPLQDKKLDQIYVFQFPPKLPDLINEVKAEPESSPTLPAVAGAAATPGSSAAQNSAPIKIEDDEPISRAATFAFSRSTHLPTLNPGRVGKLKIHSSGKATLDWGGTSLQLNKAIDASFAQDVIMVRLATQQSADARSEAGGEALAFGQVRGKFSVAPDWEAMLG